jgi:hypothetical protein
MKQTLIKLAFIVTFAGCGGTGPAGPPGATGATGATGSGYDASRDDIECRSTTLPVDNVYVSAYCSNVDDVPVSGGCSLPPGGAGVRLVTDTAVSWEASKTQAAGWSCAWEPDGVGFNGAVEATATICCIKHP